MNLWNPNEYSLFPCNPIWSVDHIGTTKLVTSSCYVHDLATGNATELVVILWL